MVMAIQEFQMGDSPAEASEPSCDLRSSTEITQASARRPWDKAVFKEDKSKRKKTEHIQSWGPGGRPGRMGAGVGSI